MTCRDKMKCIHPENLEKPATKMTVSEIEEKLGYKIEVVAEK